MTTSRSSVGKIKQRAGDRRRNIDVFYEAVHGSSCSRSDPKWRCKHIHQMVPASEETARSLFDVSVLGSGDALSGFK